MRQTVAVPVACSLFAALARQQAHAGLSEPKPQIIFVANKAQKAPWSSGMTLAQALIKFGGTSASYV